MMLIPKTPKPCGEQVKYEIAKILATDASLTDPASQEAIAFQQKVLEKYAYCANVPSPVRIDRREFCSAISWVGNLGYERMTCCGYDPQKRLFACPIRIERPYGFGAFGPVPLGSFEHVLTCVDFGHGYEEVARDRVHVTNAEPQGGSPPWQFAVVARANELLARQPLKGQVYRARSILSWAFAPTSCKDFRGPWGNALDYQIRLDP